MRIIGKINPEDKHVHIWGAGFAGLVLGYYLKDQGFKITIYESSGKAGGKVTTKKTPAGLVEKGPNALYLNEDGLDLLKKLGIEPMATAPKLKRLLMINGKPKRVTQLTLLAKLALNCKKKPPLISDGLTVAEFFRPLIGQENINKYLSPILGGIYATPAENLHFKSVFSDISKNAQYDSYLDFIKLLRKEKKQKPKTEVSGSVSFEGGMQMLINRLTEVLKDNIKFNHKEPFSVKGNTVICTDSETATEFLRVLKPDLASELKRIKYQELSSVTVFLKKEIKSLSRAFGVLIPLNGTFNSIGVVNNKAVFPKNYESSFSYTFISRKKCSEDDIKHDINLMSDDITTDDIIYMDAAHWDRALPIYDLQRYLSIKKLHQLSKKEDHLAIFGNYVAGISLREMISAAKAFAKNPLYYPEV